jgi:hypothetical protein
MIVRRPLLIALIVAFPIQFAFSHSGGTNADGCHTDHRTGDYHCHHAKRENPERQTYCHMINGESRCGYSQSACSKLVSTYGGYCQQE